ncbi:MAG: hypothetical protein IT546_01215 [Caulobacteraceae bacterium]|nr:hypothetical protein [Caulobacteraceae bacterium]
MATVTGTGGSDFIHVSGDGLTPGAGQTNNTQATNGDDTITPGGGDDVVRAGGGYDTVIFTGFLRDYTILLLADGSISVEDLRSASSNGHDVLKDVEKLVFIDGSIDVSTPVIRFATNDSDHRVSISEGAFTDTIEIVFDNSPLGGRLTIFTDRETPVGLALDTGDGNDAVFVNGDLSRAGLSTDWLTYQQGVGQSSTLETAPPLSVDLGDGDDLINMGGARFGGARYGDPLKTWTTTIELGAGDDEYFGPQLDNVIISDTGGDNKVSASGRGAGLDLSQFGVTAGQTGFAIDLTQNQVTSPSSLMAMDIAALQYMYGSAGNDSFIGNNSANIFNFVSGVDTAAFGGQEPGRFDLGSGVSIMIVDLQAGTAFDLGPGPGAVFTSIHFTGMEGWIGSRGADILRGDEVGNLFFGDGGNDEIDGRGGIDIALFPGAFADYTRGTGSGGAITVADNRVGDQLPSWQVSGGVDTLRGIEILGFSDGLRSADPNAGAAFHVNAADWANGLLPRGVVGSSASDSLKLELSGEVEASINFDPLGFGLGLGGASPIDIGASQLDEMDIYAPQVGSLRLDGDLGGIGPLLNPLDVFGGDIDNTFDASGLTGRVNLEGGGGADILSGGKSNDILNGGAGSDKASYAPSSADFSWWQDEDGTWRAHDLRADSPLGTDQLIDIEAILFGDRMIKLSGATNAEALGLAFEQVMRIAAPTGADLTFLNGLISAVDGGTKTLEAAYGEIVQRADGSTAVAAMSYQFFAGFAPSKGGFDFLVNPEGPNANNLNAPYYQDFNTENRYINFAVNLGKVGEGKAAFEADYGSLTLRQATAKAYQEIFGGTTPNEAFLNLLLDADIGGGMTRKDYFAFYGGDGLTGLGTKAAMVGWLLTEAAKADLGTLARSSNAYLADLADGAPFLVDLIGVYAQPEWAHNPPG